MMIDFEITIRALHRNCIASLNLERYVLLAYYMWQNKKTDQSKEKLGSSYDAACYDLQHLDQNIF